MIIVWPIASRRARQPRWDGGSVRRMQRVRGECFADEEAEGRGMSSRDSSRNWKSIRCSIHKCMYIRNLCLCTKPVPSKFIGRVLRSMLTYGLCVCVYVCVLCELCTGATTIGKVAYSVDVGNSYETHTHTARYRHHKTHQFSNFSPAHIRRSCAWDQIRDIETPLPRLNKIN